MESLSERIALIKQAIAAREALRATRGDEATDQAIARLRAQLQVVIHAERQEVTDADIQRVERDAEAAAAPPVVERRPAAILHVRVDRIVQEDRADGDMPDVESFVASLVPVVHAHGGNVERWTHDMILAHFPAHAGSRDQAERAVRTALDLHANAARFGHGTGTAVQTRCGIHAGTLVGTLRHVDEGGRSSITHAVPPEAFAAAMSLSEAAEPGATRVDADTHSQTRSEFAFRVATPSPDRPAAPVYEVLDPDQLRSGDGPVRPLGRAGFTGRRQQWQQLMVARQALLRGEGRITWLTGTSGAGKSRFLTEIHDAIVADEVTWASACAAECSVLRPFAVVGELVRNLVKTHATTDGPFWQQLRQVVLDEPDDAPPRWLAVVCRVAEGALPDQEAVDLRLLSSSAFRALAFLGTTQLLERLADNQPTILACDDIHDADESSLELLAHVARLATELPIWFVFTRTDASRKQLTTLFESLAETDRQAHIEIGPLGENAALNMARDLLVMSELPPSLEKEIANWHGGLPLGIDQLCQWLVEVGAIKRESTTGAGTLTPAASHVQVPATVEQLITSRLDGISAEEQSVIEHLQAFSRPANEAMLAAACPPGVDVAGILANLENRRLVQASPCGSRFSVHSMCRDAMARALPMSARRALHQDAAQAIAGLGELHPDHTPALMAWQLARAADWEQARAWLIAAADSAWHMGAWPELLAYGQMLVEMRGSRVVPEDKAVRDATLERRMAVANLEIGRYPGALAGLKSGLRHLGEELPTQRKRSRFARTGEVLRRGRRLLDGVMPRRTSGGQRAAVERARTLAMMAKVLLRLDRANWAHCVARLAEFGAESDDRVAVATAARWQALASICAAALARAQDQVDVARKAADSLERPVVTARVLQATAALLAARGEVNAALACCDSGADAAWSVAEIRAWAAHRGIGAALLFATGDLEQAEAVYGQVLAIAEQANEVTVMQSAAAGAAMVALHRRGPEGAAAWLSRPAVHTDVRGDTLSAATLAAQRHRCARPGERDDAALLELCEHSVDSPLAPIQVLRLQLTLLEALLDAAASANGRSRANLLDVARARIQAMAPGSALLPWRPEALRLAGDWLYLSGRQDEAVRRWREAESAASLVGAPHQAALVGVALARMTGDDAAAADASAQLAELGARHDSAAVGT